VVIGRSNIVGKPMAMMLLAANATVTICHSGTADLAAMTRQADIVVAAVGKRNVLTADMVKPGAVVIDVGMNRNDEGKLCGDVDFDGVQASRRLDHPRARRRRPHDHHHAAGQHPGSGRARCNHRIDRCRLNPLPPIRHLNPHEQSPPRLLRPAPVRPHHPRARGARRGQLLAAPTPRWSSVTAARLSRRLDAIARVLDVATERWAAPGAP
jgi:hypothetical protein